jgi:hypothetical protein
MSERRWNRPQSPAQDVLRDGALEKRPPGGCGDPKTKKLRVYLY